MSAIPRALRKGWCPGALRPMETGDGLLVRVRPRAGSFSLEAMTAIADTAARFGSSQIDLTNRANLQLRGLSSETFADAIAALSAAGVLDETAAIEAVRNVIVDPLSGLDPQRVDVGPLAAALEHRLAVKTDLHALPGKFGISLSGTASPLATQAAADIALAMPTPAECVITLDGDPSRGVRIPATGAVSAIERLARAFLTIAAQHETVRRMRDAVVLSGSADMFARAGLECDVTPSAAPAATSAQRTGLIGPVSHPFAMAVGLPFGRIDAATLTSLCNLARQHNGTRIRPSAQRTLVLPLNSAATASVLLELANKSNLITSDDDPRLMMDVCPGAPSCRNATTSTRADALSLVAAFEAAGRPMPAVHISGCEKGCARRSSAALTLVARNGAYDLISNGPVNGSAVLTGIAPQVLAGAITSYLTEPAP